MKFILVALISITFAGVNAQKNNCCKPPAFSFEDLPEAMPQPGHGTSVMPVHSNVDSVQYYANQGVNMYFSFNYYESFMAFYKAYKLDTNCVSCLLGTLVNLEQAEEESELYYDLYDRANEIYHSDSIEMTDFERALLELEVGTFSYKRKFQDDIYDQRMHELYEEFSDNPVALAWYIYYLDDGLIYKDEPFETTIKADSIVQKVISKFYDNAAVLHMGIHLYEELNPPKALELAERIEQTAPNSGHIVHMPGHAYYYNGMYDKAIEAFKKSYLVDSAYNAKNTYAIDLNWNYIHNLDFLCLTLAEQGQLKEADDWAKKLGKATNIWNNGIGGEINPKLHTVPMLVPYRLMRWQKASEQAEVLLNQGLEFDNEFFVKGFKLYFDGMHAFEQDHDDTLAVILDKMKKHIKTGKKLRKDNKGELGAEYIYTYTDVLQIHKRILSFLLDNKNETSDDIVGNIYRIEHEIWEYQLSDPPAIPLLFEELIAVLYEKQRNFNGAIDILKEALDRKPNSGPILLHLARMYYRAGQKTESRAYLKKFHEAWADADKELIEFEKARVLEINLNK